MRLESLDGLGACAPEKNKTLTYVLPASQIKSMGLTSTAKVLDNAGISYTTTTENGQPEIKVGNKILPGFVPLNSQKSVLAAAVQGTQAEPAVTETEATPSLTTNEKKAIGFTALALLALAALASQLKSKPGAINGISTPRKKMAYTRL